MLVIFFILNAISINVSKEEKITACTAAVFACFSAAGFTFGIVPVAVIAATPALGACYGTYGTCNSGCALISTLSPF